MQNEVILLLGSNLGNKEFYLQEALKEIEFRVGKLVETSFILETEPLGFDSHNTFLNQAVKIKTALSPISLLNRLQEIEINLGRKEKTIDSYQDRTMDIDIITYNSIQFSSRRLTIPHNLHLNEREFSKLLLEDLS